MRRRFVLLPMLLIAAACSKEPSMDDRFESESARLNVLESDLQGALDNQAALSAESDEPWTLTSPVAANAQDRP